MAQLTNGSYDAIDMLRATIQWSLYNKLTGATAGYRIWWGYYVKSLEPSWTEPLSADQKAEFIGRLHVPNRELLRAGLHFDLSILGYNTDNPERFMLGEDMLRNMKTMKKSELDAWAEYRLYEALPWLTKR